MTGRNQHLPDFIYFELYAWAHENRISYQQLMYEILRDGIENRRGKKCLHDQKDRKFSRKTKQWYCRACFTFFDMRNTGKTWVQDERQPIWKLKKEMSNEEWAKQIKPDNDDLK